MLEFLEYYFTLSTILACVLLLITNIVDVVNDSNPSYVSQCIFTALVVILPLTAILFSLRLLIELRKAKK